MLGAEHGSPNYHQMKHYFTSVELMRVKLKLAHASNAASKLGLCSSNSPYSVKATMHLQIMSHK